MIDFEKYAGFSADEFLNDDDFIRFTSANSTERESFIIGLKKHYPEKTEAIDQVIRLLEVYQNQNAFDNRENRQPVWERIEASIEKEKARSSVKIIRLKRFLQAAAVFALIFSAGFFGWYYLGNKEISTAKGQILNVTLPDGSQVTLNGNSSIRYHRAWFNTQVREVWIRGEALFKVQHINRNVARIKPGERFIVHGRRVNIEVLGTTFNVFDRHEKTDVGLISGKIKVDYLEKNKANSLVMRPGETVRYQNNKPVVKRRSISPVYITAWARRQLIFKDASLGDIIETLENNYGYKISLKDSVLLNTRIEGTINVPDVPQLLETVSSALHLHVQQNDNTIEITPN